jgi:hypothetical protein
MEKLIKELRQAILVWTPSPDDERIFWNLNQLLISIRDKIPLELTPHLKKFMHLHPILRCPEGTPKEEFERQLNQLLLPRRFVWEVKEHHDLFKMWFREQTEQSLEVKRTILDVICDALSFIREKLPEIVPTPMPVLEQSLEKTSKRKWKVKENDEAGEELSLFST